MDRVGYLLSEIPTFIFVIWFAVRLLQYRRRRNNQPVFTDRDRRMLFQRPKNSSEKFKFYLKLALAVVSVTAVGFLQFITLAPLGAAILSGTFLLTSAAIVRQLLMDET